MTIEQITEQRLLEHPNLRSVDFEHTNYFVKEELNSLFMGAFHNSPSVVLPLLNSNGERVLTKCINYAEIARRQAELSGKSDFHKGINILLGYNPKKKS